MFRYEIFFEFWKLETMAAESYRACPISEGVVRRNFIRYLMLVVLVHSLPRIPIRSELVCLGLSLRWATLLLSHVSWYPEKSFGSAHLVYLLLIWNISLLRIQFPDFSRTFFSAPPLSCATRGLWPHSLSYFADIFGVARWKTFRKAVFIALFVPAMCYDFGQIHFGNIFGLRIFPEILDFT